jgi:hypothetical protein
MDTTESPRGDSEEVDPSHNHSPASSESPKELPEDLPKSLDDRRSVPVYQQETEMYDAWQGKNSLLLTRPFGRAGMCPMDCVPSDPFPLDINLISLPGRTIAIPHHPRRRKTLEL